MEALQVNVSKRNEEEANMKENAENELKESRAKQQEKENEMRELKERVMLMEQQLKLEGNSFQEKHFLQQQQQQHQQHEAKSIKEVDPTEMEEKMKIESLTKQQAKEMKQKALKERLIRQQLIFDRQQKEIQVPIHCSSVILLNALPVINSKSASAFDALIGTEMCPLLY